MPVLLAAIAADAVALQPAPLRSRPVLAAARASRPAMLDAGTFTLLADAAVLLPEGAASGASAAAAVTEAAAEPGWFDYLIVLPFEYAITALHDLLKSMGVEEAYGLAIIMFTVGVKALTFPLTKVQIESTTKMQAIAPAAKALQAKYRERDPARLNAELQKLYQDNEVNPLAGCLPAFAQIPLFIGLYRSLLNLAKEDRLTESFLFLPSLEGPVREYTEGISWLTTWDNGAPKLGWDATLAYLVLPVVLVLSQYASTSLLTPKTDDPAQQQSQAILKFLPLMIGWFSLSVPSGLGLYWLTNNIVTTATTLAVRASVGTPELAVSVESPAAADPKPAGFGRRYGEIIETTDNSDGTKVTIRPPGATRKERRAAAAAADTAPLETAAFVETSAVATGAVVEAQPVDMAAPSKSAAKKKAKARAKKRSNKK